jgi:hypothetical protein
MMYLRLQSQLLNRLQEERPIGCHLSVLQIHLAVLLVVQAL